MKNCQENGMLLDRGPKIKSPKTDTECKCPKCKKIHFMDLHWIGKTPAWKYCPTCQKSANYFGKMHNLIPNNGHHRAKSGAE